MTSTVARTPIAPPQSAAAATQQATDTDRTIVVDVEPPFSDYESQNGKPFLVDHYELGSLWNHRDMYSEGFEGEVGVVTSYIDGLIAKGEINNTVEAVRSKLKDLEKVVNVRNDDRKAVRVGKVAAYVEFLMKSDNIQSNSAKYGLA